MPQIPERPVEGMYVLEELQEGIPPTPSLTIWCPGCQENIIGFHGKGVSIGADKLVETPVSCKECDIIHDYPYELIVTTGEYSHLDPESEQGIEKTPEMIEEDMRKTLISYWNYTLPDPADGRLGDMNSSMAAEFSMRVDDYNRNAEWLDWDWSPPHESISRGVGVNKQYRSEGAFFGHGNVEVFVDVLDKREVEDEQEFLVRTYPCGESPQDYETEWRNSGEVAHWAIEPGLSRTYDDPVRETD